MNHFLKRVTNPPNPYSKFSVEWLDVPPQADLQVYEEQAKSIVTTNKSPDIPFNHGVNPYRGCFHGCAYCYARPTHQYLDFGAGTDFEKKIIVKVNAAEKLKEHFLKKSWKGEPISFSGITDCYQPLEASYEITRKCLIVCEEFSQPLGIVTKGALVRRDIDVLQSLHSKTAVKVMVSLAFKDDKTAKALEPFTPRPSTRIKVIEELAKANIPVGIALAPVICGLSDSHIPEILQRASDAGASSAFMVLLRLPAEVKEVFTDRLNQAFPEKAKKILNQLSDMKNGKLNRTQFGLRMHGTGARWEAIEWMFYNTCNKLGIRTSRDMDLDEYGVERVNTFTRPTKQLSLI